MVDIYAAEIGMENLWIAFSGYWPERDVRLETGTFKELVVQGGLFARMVEAQSID